MYTFPNVKKYVQKWKPKKKYSKELEYRDGLLSYLRKQMNQPSLFSKEYIIKKESGRALADIIVHDGRSKDGVGIELKYNLRTKSQTDRLYGQVDSYLREYHDVIIVLCGDTNQEQLYYLKEKIRNIPKIFQQLEIVLK